MPDGNNPGFIVPPQERNHAGREQSELYRSRTGENSCRTGTIRALSFPHRREFMPDGNGQGCIFHIQGEFTVKGNVRSKMASCRGRNKQPMPQTVFRKTGVKGCGSIFSLSFLIYIVMVFVSPAC